MDQMKPVFESLSSVWIAHVYHGDVYLMSAFTSARCIYSSAIRL